MVDPWRAGNFFAGDFIRFGTDAIQSVSQRLVTTVNISAKPQMDVLPLTTTFVNSFLAFTENRVEYFYVNSTTNLIEHGTTAPKSNMVTRNMIGGSPPPGIIVLLDETGSERFLTPRSFASYDLVASVPFSGDYSEFIFYAGDYLEMVGNDGKKIYRITVDSSNVISVTFNREERERFDAITISNGHRKPYDDNSDLLFTEALIDIGPISRRLVRTQLGWGGVSVPQIGKISIQLANEDFRFLCSQSFDGRTVYVQNGLESDPISSYRVIAYGITNHAEFDTNTINIFFKDNINLLEREIQKNTYAGTGGVEGGTEVKGKVKPLAYGRINHATPTLLDYNAQLYQIHDGIITGNLQVYTGGILRPGAAFQNLTTLLNWVPSSSEIASGVFRTHLGGPGTYFRLANNPLGAITVVFDGDSACSGAANNIANVTRSILQKGASEFVFDTGNQAELLEECRQLFGIFIDQPTTVGEILDQIITPSGAFLSARRSNGLARVRQLRRRAPRAVIQESDLIEIGRPINIRNTQIPPRSIRLGYDKTWTVLNEADLLGAASQTPNVKNILMREYAYIEQANPDNLADPNLKRFTTKSSETFDTLFVSNASGNTQFINGMAAFLISRLYSLNWIYTMTIKGYQFEFDLGDTLLLDISRWDLRNPTPVMIIEIVEESTIGMSSLDQGLTKLVMLG